MTPFYDLNPPFPLVELKQQLFLSPQQAASSSLSDHHHHAPSFFNPRVVLLTKPEESKPYDDHKVNNFQGYEGSSDPIQPNSSSSLQSGVEIHGATSYRHDNNGSSVKWMSSKMRLMKKMVNSNCSSTNIPADDPNKYHQHPIHDTNRSNNNSIRVCSDCNTTTTPLWRSGPRGPKSLCNACGIRRRKARRAMEAAAAATENGAAAVATDAKTSVKIKVHNNKEKKSRTSHVGQYKKQFKLVHSDYNQHHHNHQSKKKLCFKEFALSLSKNSALQRVFPQDVEDAAILLMELSCGLVHS
ncbi:hypothetical protein PTKIN_Ptkin19aG0103300 [Pterospermum kingtungense]